MVKKLLGLVLVCVLLVGCTGQPDQTNQMDVTGQTNQEEQSSQPDQHVMSLRYSLQDIRPELRAHIEQTAPVSFDEEGLKVVRAETDVLVGSSDLPVDPAIKVYDQYIPRADTGEDMRVRIYEPVNKSEVLPAVFWIHGGGMVISHPEGDEAQCIRFAKEVNCVVIAPDYRLAPEHPYPAAPDDCYAALQWTVASAHNLGIDPARIAVAGASAGGGLSLSTALRARDEGGPQIAFLMPIYPMINDKLDTESAQATYEEDIDGRILTGEAVRHMWEYYLSDTEDVSEYAAPLRETDWSGLPPVYTCVGDIDPFRDDTIALVKNLIAAGNTPEFHLYPGCPHAFDSSDPGASISVYAVSEWIRVLTDALWQE